MNVSTRDDSRARLLFGFIAAGVCALSIHVVMLQVLDVPFPDMSTVGAPYRYLGRFASVFGLIALCQLSCTSISASFFKRWGVTFLLYQMLNEEIFRAPFMDAYCTTAWAFPFVSQLPRWLSAALLSGSIAFVAPTLRLNWQRALGAAMLAALSMFAFAPLCAAIFKGLLQSLSYLAPTGEWCTLPYGASVLVPAYVSFVEPTLACFLAFALTRNALSSDPWWRLAQFVLMIVAIKNQLLTPFIYAFLAKSPGLGALASEGQFALEALVLAFMTGLAWMWAGKGRRGS